VVARESAVVSAVYVMFGHPERRRWEDARHYGLVSAGGGRRWSAPLERLSVGDEVFVHVPGRGYFGVGIVEGEPRPAVEHVVLVDGLECPLLDAPLVSSALGWGDADTAEFVVPVRWTATVPEAPGYWRPGLFCTQTTVWPLDDEKVVAEIRHWLGAHRMMSTRTRTQ
jgi:hypothetical protein